MSELPELEPLKGIAIGEGPRRPKSKVTYKGAVLEGEKREKALKLLIAGKEFDLRRRQFHEAMNDSGR